MATTTELKEILAMGSRPWNAWRRKHPKVDLSGGGLVESPLAGAVLYGSNLSRVNLANADLSEAKLNMAKLTNANLAKSDLSGTALIEANL